MNHSVLDEIATGKGFSYDDELPRLIKAFIEEFCIQSKHPWSNKPLILTDFQYDEWIKPAYGWRNSEGTLRYNRCLIYAPKKVMGKTAITSALGLFHFQQYPGSSCALIASSIKQARNLYDNCFDFVQLSPLGDKMKTHKHVLTISYDEERSLLEVLSSRPEVSGGSYNFLSWDEVCEFAPSTAELVYARLKHSTAARHNSMQVYISTANYCSTEHLGYRLYTEAKGIISGKNVTDYQTLAIVKEVPTSVDWRNPDIWEKYIPIGLTVSKQYYIDEYNKAKDNPSDLLAFRVFMLNQFVQQSAGENALVDTPTWEACQTDFDESELYGLPSIAAADLARKHDLAGYVIATPKDGKIYLTSRAFIPSDIAQRKEKYDSVPYRLWSETNAGLTLTQGDTIDQRVIMESILQDRDRFCFDTLLYDPTEAELLRQMLVEQGLNCVEFPQTFTHFSPCISHFQRSCINKTIAHNNPILSWCVGNSIIKRDTKGLVMIEKMKSTNRIDLAVCAVMAMQHFLAAKPTEWQGSYFSSL